MLRQHEVAGYIKLANQKKGMNLGLTKNSRGLEAGKRWAQSSHCSVGRSELATDRQEDELRHVASVGIESKEARRTHSRGQKAVIVGDEEALGGTQKERLVRSVPDRVPLPNIRVAWSQG